MAMLLTQGFSEPKPPLKCFVGVYLGHEQKSKADEVQVCRET
jgi:hypothetical protein